MPIQFWSVISLLRLSFSPRCNTEIFNDGETKENKIMLAAVWETIQKRIKQLKSAFNCTEHTLHCYAGKVGNPFELVIGREIPDWLRRRWASTAWYQNTILKFWRCRWCDLSWIDAAHDNRCAFFDRFDKPHKAARATEHSEQLLSVSTQCSIALGILFFRFFIIAFFKMQQS